MAFEIHTPDVKVIDDIKDLLGKLADYPGLNTSEGPKVLRYTTLHAQQLTGDDPQLEGVCAQLCGHLLALVNLPSTDQEAAHMHFTRTSKGAVISINGRYKHREGKPVAEVEISDSRNKMTFEERGEGDNVYCNLNFIRV